MSGGVPDMICVAQITFKFVNHALIVYSRRFLFFWDENLANLLALENRCYLNADVFYFLLGSLGNFVMHLSS